MPTVPTPHDHALPAETLDEKGARLNPLGPLREVIARTIRTTPVRLGPGGTDDLVDELTLAVALYTAREVLPVGLLGAAERCDVEFVDGRRCAKSAGHRPPGSDDPHTP